MATLAVRSMVGSLDQNQLLYFYARFKQAKEGPNENPQPGFFSFEARRKWQAWHDLGDMSRVEAMRSYIEKVEELNDNWREEELPQDEGKSGWVSVSTMQNTDKDEEIDEKDKTLFDWVKENNLKMAQKELKERRDVDHRDEDGMSALHWAADRGNAEMVELLIKAGAKIDAQDSEGQSALHFAASCGHSEVVRVLLKTGADSTVKDNDGFTAKETANDRVIKDLL